MDSFDRAGSANLRYRRSTLVTALAFGLFFVATAQTPAADNVEYNRDIRPILRENCFACHGPDSAARKAEL
jgi:mono/diheme cytochrome c family protein